MKIFQKWNIFFFRVIFLIFLLVEDRPCSAQSPPRRAYTPPSTLPKSRPAPKPFQGLGKATASAKKNEKKGEVASDVELFYPEDAIILELEEKKQKVYESFWEYREKRGIKRTKKGKETYYSPDF